MDFPHDDDGGHVPSQQQQQQHYHHHHGGHPSISYQNYPIQPQQVEPYYAGPHHAEYADFGPITPDQEEFEGSSEILTRPRLTKEQVEVLEAQFQAHPKPNSNVKRQLALQTKLTLPRVANWFQNRRAKAKQMRKQEEFEMTQGRGIGEAWNNDRHIPTGYTIPLQINTAAAATRSIPSASSGGTSHLSAASSSAEISSGRDSVQEAGWASLQRALNAANTARSQYNKDQDQTFTPLLYGNPHQPSEPSICQDQNQFGPPSLPEWRDSTTAGPWNVSSQKSEDSDFNFGFAGQPLDQNSPVHEQQRVESPEAIQAYTISADMWSGVAMPTMNANAPHGTMALHESEPLPLPCFPSPRRGSSSDELTASLDQFVLAGTPRVVSPVIHPLSEQFRKPETNVDIAARRKRPRPAALGSAALRSYSYGGPPTMSPTFRFGRTSQNAHSIRHVKSTGQNLNVTYGGIRKLSSSQKSPLNIATFAEAEEFNNLMADRKLSRQMESEQACAPPTPHSNDDLMRSQLPIPEEPVFAEQEEPEPNQYFLNGQPSHFSMASPPSTPMKADFFAAAQMSSMMPAISAPPQYAIFPDYTPPYSAGPLPTSTWSDAPLTSPEMAPFPPPVHNSQHGYVSPMIHEYNSRSSFPSHLIPHEAAEQRQTDITPPAHTGQKRTEFFIQEFPRQREEHAHAAQQMAQQRPKNYVFANATPSDF